MRGRRFFFNIFRGPVRSASLGIGLYLALIFLILAFPQPVSAAKSLSHDSELARGHFVVNLDHERLSVRANSADLREVLKAIGKKNGVAIQIDPEVKGTVTTSFKDLPVQEGLRRLAGSYALVFSKDAESGRKKLLRVSVLQESTPETLSSNSKGSASSGGLQSVRKSGSRAPGFPTSKRVIDGVLRKEEKNVEYVPNEILVKLKPDVPEESIQVLLSRLDATILKRYGKIGYFRLELPPETSVAEALAILEDDPIVDVVEPNYIVHATLLPNDPSFSQLWGLHNTGQTGGTADADIDAPEAWDVQRGSASVVAAVIDTGVDYTHPDLAANMWTNQDEIPGNGIDDDNNGYVDDYRGWDFYNNDNDPMDDHSHGTHVSGTIAAVGDNGVGVAGVVWTARIMPLKFLSSGGSGYVSDAVEAVLYAAANGAKVLNNSWGGGGYSQALYDAIQTANDAGSLFIVAAGNNSSDNDYSPYYPASYDVANVVSVAASTSSDGLASFSNWGANTVDLAAPGASIYSTVPGGGYGTKSGTSMATPHVAGAAAILMAQFPDHTHLEVRSLLLESVDPKAAFSGMTVTGGRLNISTPIACQSGTLAVSNITPSDGTTVALNEPLTLSARVTECGSAIPGAAVSASFSSGETTLTLFDDGAHDDGAASDGIYGISWTPSVEGDVSVTVDASASGYTPGSASSTVTIRDVITYQHDDTYPYQWIDAAQGTNLGITGDDSSVLADLGFSFEFYGVSYTQVTVASNGYLTFGTDGTRYINDPIPTASSPNAVIAPFWDDLNPSAGGTVYILSSGTAPNRSVTIQWTDLPHYSNVGAVTFQVTLYEGSNDIVMQYQDVTFGDAALDNGANATVGVEDADGLFGTQYSYNQATISAGKAIRFYNNADTLSVSPSGSVDFGSVTVGSTADQSFTVTNTGSGTLTGTASTSAPFSIVSGGSYTLAAGASATVVVRFSPTAAQSYNGSVDFASDGGDASRSVTGTGEAAPALDVSPAGSVDFGTVTIGSSADQSFTITNSGGGTLTGTASTSAPFSIVSGGSYSLTAGQSATVVVRFSPTAAGSASGSVSFTSDGGNATRSVTGVGEAAPVLDVSPSTTVDFGTVTVGSSADQNFTVTNSGGGTLTGTASTSAPFSVVSGGSYTLAAGASATVVVRFSPTAAGSASGSVSFTSDGGNATRTVTGTGEEAPALSVSPTSTVDFGTVTLGSTTDRSFTVTNTGGGTLSGSASTSAPFSIVSGSFYTLTAGQSATVVVRFSPTSAQSYTGSVSFTSDAGNATRTVTGAGEAAPALSVSPTTTVDFGTVTIGSSADQSFTVTNSGGGTLTGTASTSAPFSIVSGGSYTLTAGQSATVVVRFSPTSAQSYTGSVSFTSDGGNATRSVTGVGEAAPVLDVSPSATVDFGTVTVGSSADQSFTVTNSGGGTLTGTASTSAPFSIVSGGSYALSAGQSATVVVRFSPTAAGSASGSVSFASDGGNATRTVTGTGEAAPALSVSPSTTVDFGTVTVGSSADQSFTVTNSGGGTLTGTASTAAPFSIVSGGSYTLTADQSATVVVRFSPTSAQSYTGSVSFTSDAGNATRTVTGTGEAAPAQSVSPATTVDFGTVTVGSSADQSFTVTNSGGGTLTGTASTAAPFSIVSGGSYTLTAGQSASVVVRFSPTAAQSYNGSVSFASDGGNASRAVTGVGEAAPALDVSPAGSVDFGTVTIGSSADQSFTVTNSGGGTLTGTASTSAPFSIVSGGSYTLTASQSASVVVRFSPTAAGSASGSVSFTSDGGNAARTVTGVGEELSPPAPLSPSGNISDTTPTFTWSAVSGATQYRLQVYDSTTDGYPINTTTTDTSFTPGSALASDHSFIWWVQAGNAAGWGAWSSGMSFTLAVEVTEAPTLVSPSGSISDDTPTFSWTAVTGATRYMLQVYDATTGGYPINTTTTDTSFTPSSALASDHSFIWWVQAGNAAGWGPWSSGMNFTLAVVITDRPTPISPSGKTADTTPTFSWSAVSGATKYVLQVYDRETGAYPINTITTETSYTPSAALPLDHRFFWWVQAGNAAGWGPWSRGSQFATSVDITERATLLSPSGDITDTTPTFSWSSVPGATKYVLQVYDRETGEYPINTITTETSYTPSAALPLDHRFVWWVLAGNAAGWGPWSSGMRFTIVQSSLSGTWQTYAVKSGGTEEGWLQGSVTLDAEGTVTSGSLKDVSGADAVVASGQASLTETKDAVNLALSLSDGNIDVSQASINATDNLMVGVGAHDGSPMLVVMVKDAEEDFMVADFEGTWQVYSVASGGTPPGEVEEVKEGDTWGWWQVGPSGEVLDGSVATSEGDVYSSAVGQINTMSDGTFSGSLTYLEGTEVTLTSVSLNPQKTLAVAVGHTDDGGTIKHVLLLATRLGWSFEQSNMVGTWQSYTIESSPAPQWEGWRSETLEFDATGTSIGGLSTSSDGTTGTSSESKLTLDAEGRIVGELGTAGGLLEIQQGTMTGSGNEMAWVSYDKEKGTYSLNIAIRPPEAK